MITVVTFLWGDWGGKYAEHYVNALYNSIKRNTTKAFKFVCFSDRRPFNEEIIFKPMDGAGKLRWNLKKQIAHREDPDVTGQVFLIDLDMIITGSLDNLFSYTGNFASIQGVYKNRKGRPAGGFLSFPAGRYHREIWRELVVNHRKLNSFTGGSERILLDILLCGYKFDFWNTMFPNQILSYREHVKKDAPVDDCRIVWFHGIPKPHELIGRKGDKWLMEHWV